VAPIALLLLVLSMSLEGCIREKPREGDKRDS
jgi:hypothetical protein